jgi:hypothetical protein
MMFFFLIFATQNKTVYSSKAYKYNMHDHHTTTLLHLDSRHRTNSQSDGGGKAVFHLSTPLRPISCVELISASIPVSWYSVVQNKNAFTLSHGGNDSTVTIVPGQYTLATLAQAITSAINIANFQVTTHQPTLRLVFQFNAAFTVRIPSEELASVLGFTAVNTPFASVNNALTSPSIPELIPAYVSVCVKQLGSGYSSGTGREEPALFMIPVDQVSGGNLNFNSQSHYAQPKKYDVSMYRQIAQLDVDVRDSSFGNTIDFNGLPWSIVLRVTHA